MCATVWGVGAQKEREREREIAHEMTMTIEKAQLKALHAQSGIGTYIS